MTIPTWGNLKIDEELARRLGNIMMSDGSKLTPANIAECLARNMILDRIENDYELTASGVNDLSRESGVPPSSRWEPSSNR
jgi:hypothetical protein